MICQTEKTDGQSANLNSPPKKKRTEKKRKNPYKIWVQCIYIYKTYFLL